jgi:hypothetical protein
MQSEPKIIINGVPLTEAQAMTLRVALQAFSIDLKTVGLGDDAIGRSIAAGYRARIGEINEIMMKESS